MDQRRKLTIIVLIVLTFVLGLGSLVLTQIVRNNQAPTDSAASGFGEGATNQLYDDVFTNFKGSACEPFINVDDLTKDPLLGITKVNTLKFVAEGRVPLKCLYELDENKSIILELFSYNASSQIDKTQQDLFNRINGELLLDELDKGNANGIDYFYGQGTNIGIENICRTTMFHVQNDFEYALVSYYGFEDCSKLVNLNKDLTSKMMGSISDTMVGINSNFINEPISLTGYKNIRQALQSVSCAYLLTERKDREANSPELIFSENSYFKTLPSEGDQLKQCEYKFNANRTYNLKIRGIDLINNDPVDFKDNVSSLFNGTVATGNDNNIEYKYGKSIDGDNICRVVAFLPNDEYTFLDITYNDLSCTEETDVKGVVTNFTESTRKLIDSASL